MRLSCVIKPAMTIPEAAYIYSYDVDLLKMSRVMLETCRGFFKNILYINK
jgi:hypothetical protein